MQITLLHTRRSRSFLTLCLFVLASACVTININFPAAQATDIAEKIVNDIYQAQPSVTPPEPNSSARSIQQPFLIVLLDAFMQTAHAVDVNTSSPEVRRIQAQLKQRASDLMAFYTSGAIGLTSKGLLTVRDKKSIPLKSKQRVDKWVKADNADRLALYKAIAKASGHPEWHGQLQATFAKAWIKNAKSGWWYQSKAGAWTQK